MKRNFAAIATACILSAAGSSMAEPLDANACAQLRLELGTLERGGARTFLARGPEWAKGNLKPDQLGLVDRLLEVEAQFLFRCPQPKRIFDAATEAVLESGVGSDPASDEKQAAGSAGTPGSTKPPLPDAAAVKKPPGRPKSAAVKGEGAPATNAAQSTTSAVKVLPKRAAKPKPNDAYAPEPPAKTPEAQARPAQSPAANTKPLQ